MASAPSCPNCGEALDVVVDVPYGYWAWDGECYVQRFTSDRVDVAPWACVRCLGELRTFHPQDVTAAKLTAIG